MSSCRGEFIIHKQEELRSGMTFPLVSTLVQLAVVVVLVVAAAAGPSVSGEVRACPPAGPIEPCGCTTDEYYNLYLDCSNVKSNDELANVFAEGNFHLKDFYHLAIMPATPYINLTEINSFVFGDVTFQHIVISNTFIHTIYEEALTPSHETLMTLDLSDNLISSFPIETLPLFVNLRGFDIANNKLTVLPPIESSSLLSLTLQGNTGLSFSKDTFSGATELEELYLSDMELGVLPDSLPPEVFSDLNFISTIALRRNRIAGTLPPAFMKVPLDSLQLLELSDNEIVQIDPAAITGVARSVRIELQRNKIEELNEANWKPLLDQITRLQAVDLRENPLLCGCDVLWLLLEEDQLSKVNQHTTCYTGTLLSEVPLDDLLANC